VKLQILVDGQDRGEVDLTGPGILPYAGVVSSFCQILAELYMKANPDSPDYLTFSGAQISLKSRIRAPRRRRA
jgi:hypothetical protein